MGAQVPSLPPGMMGAQAAPGPLPLAATAQMRAAGPSHLQPPPLQQQMAAAAGDLPQQSLLQGPPPMPPMPQQGMVGAQGLLPQPSPGMGGVPSSGSGSLPGLATPMDGSMGGGPGGQGPPLLPPRSLAGAGPGPLGPMVRGSGGGGLMSGGDAPQGMAAAGAQGPIGMGRMGAGGVGPMGGMGPMALMQQQPLNMTAAGAGAGPPTVPPAHMPPALTNMLNTAQLSPVQFNEIGRTLVGGGWRARARREERAYVRACA